MEDNETNRYTELFFSLFDYLPVYKLIACKAHRYCVLPCNLDFHLKEKHGLNSVSRKAILGKLRDELKIRPLIWTEDELSTTLQFPATVIPSIPQLSLHTGFPCPMTNVQTGLPCRRIYRHIRGIEEHCRNEHGWKNPRRRGRTSTSAVTPQMLHFTHVHCQTFFAQRKYFVYFEVSIASKEDLVERPILPEANTTSKPDDPWHQVEMRLTAREQQATVAAKSWEFGMQPVGTYPLNLSPWLEVTRWHRYLHGYSLEEAARLIRLPTDDHLEDRPQLLLTLLTVFDRLIDDARDAILADRASVFDQHRVNSFIRGRLHHRPLLVKLQEGTYKRYKRVWHQLLCFVYYVLVMHETPLLHYIITDAQSAAMDRLLAALRNAQEEMEGEGSTNTARQEILRSKEKSDSTGLGDLCLDFCISLLDHCLKGNVYDSLVVGFLAVIGIDKKNGGFRDPMSYTPELSAFIKLAQILVMQKGIRAADAGIVDFPADLIDEMQDRFMVYGSRSPVNWAQKIRSYGCKVRDNTTTLGYITWSDDGEHLSYKNFELSMTQLRWFLRDQVQLAQEQLHDLLLLRPDSDAEDRAAVVPPLCLRNLRDDPTVKTPGWSFLLDQRNKDQLAGYDRWLLHRVRDHGWLRRQFLLGTHSVTWKKRRVESYLNLVRAFLRRLLLLIHIPGGQPARGTELLTLLWRNTRNGIRRNIFLENGLISFVTSYHKGYSITGSTKIIHRYLPPEISELLVYYLWLVVPFCDQLRVLTTDYIMADTSPSLLWSHLVQNEHGDWQEAPWLSKSLSNALAEEFKSHLGTHANIIVWRHVAIAISRRHLKQKGFKRDYGTKDDMQAVVDHQAAHSSTWAGQIYARGIEEAPGHVAPIRAEYRAISREWHTCIGFGVSLGNRPSALKLKPGDDWPSPTGVSDCDMEGRKTVENANPLKRKDKNEKSELDKWFRYGLMFNKRVRR